MLCNRLKTLSTSYRGERLTVYRVASCEPMDFQATVGVSGLFQGEKVLLETGPPMRDEVMAHVMSTGRKLYVYIKTDKIMYTSVCSKYFF